MEKSKSMYVKYVYNYSNGIKIEGCTQHHNCPKQEITPEIYEDNLNWYKWLKPKGSKLLPKGKDIELSILNQEEIKKRILNNQ